MKPQFSYEGYCRVCGKQTMISRYAECEECWKEKKKQVRKQSREYNKRREVIKLLKAIKEQMDQGGKPLNILKRLFEEYGIEK